MNWHLDLVRELKSLRKGRGVLAGRIEQRVGPTLRTAFGITESDGPVAVRQKVTTRLVDLAGQLPDDLRVATLAAFAINAEARLPLYQDRVLWAAVRMDRDPRTVRRRVDEAIDYLAELAADSPRGRRPADGWHTGELHVAVTLDRVRPEVLEQRRIVADQDGLRQLDVTPALSVGWHDLDVRVLYGGTPVDRGAGANDRLALAVPAPLGKGDSHDFAVRFELPTAQARRPCLVYVPTHPCELFDLRVRFGLDHPPQDVWVLHSAHQRDGSTPADHRRRHPVDGAGEVYLRFRRLVPGLAYGVSWEADGRSPLRGELSPEER